MFNNNFLPTTLFYRLYSSFHPFWKIYTNSTESCSLDRHSSIIVSNLDLGL